CALYLLACLGAAVDAAVGRQVRWQRYFFLLDPAEPTGAATSVRAVRISQSVTFTATNRKSALCTAIVYLRVSFVVLIADVHRHLRSHQTALAALLSNMCIDCRCAHECRQYMDALIVRLVR